MPYLISTKHTDAGYHAGRPYRVTRFAVATHFEAREEAALQIEQITGGDPDYEEVYTDAQNCSGLGDTFGPLQDGSVIEVKPVSWNWIVGVAQDLGIDTKSVHEDGGDLAILDAYNRQQEQK